MARNGSVVRVESLRSWTVATWRLVAGATFALLVLTNLAWLQSSRAGTAPAHADESRALPMPAPERVIYEYGPGVETPPAPAPLVKATPTPLQPGERCAGGQIIRRLPNGWEGLGRPCTP